MPRLEWKTDVTTVLDLLTRHLYSSRLAFLRELVSNAIDATLVSSTEHPRVGIRLQDGWLIVEDNGRGLEPSDVGSTIGCIGVSGTSGLLRARPDPELAIGAFGVGLLSARIAAERLVLVSMSRQTRQGIRLDWEGGSTFDWTPDTSRPEPGTSIALRMRPDYAALLTEESIRRFLRRNMPFVPVQLEIAGTPVGSPETPWRVPTQDVTAWVREQCEDALLAGGMAIDARGSVVVVAVPDASVATEATHRFYRSGVLVRGLGAHSIPVAHRWLSCIVELPWLTVTLDREAPTEEGKTEAEAVVEDLIDTAAGHALETLMQRPLSPAWWKRHRATIVAMLARLLTRPRSQLNPDSLIGWLPFETDRGHSTLGALVDSGTGPIVVMRRDQSDARFWGMHQGANYLFVDSVDEQVVLESMARSVRRPLRYWTRGGADAVPTGQHRYLPEVLAFVRRLDGNMNTRGLNVRIDETFTGPHGITDWISRPSWLSTPSESVYDPRWFGPITTTESRQPTLGVNPWSPLIQSLARVTDPSQLGAVGMLLVEIASTKSLGPDLPQMRLLHRRLVAALAALTELVPPAISRPRFFVSYDWNRDCDAFEVIRDVLTTPPFEWELVHPLERQSERYLLENIRACQLQAHVLVSILSTDSMSELANANVLFEAGMAEGVGGRTHLVCHRRGTQPMSDIDGLLRVEYDSTDDLRHSLRQGLLARGLTGLHGSGDRPPI